MFDRAHQLKMFMTLLVWSAFYSKKCYHQVSNLLSCGWLKGHKNADRKFRRWDSKAVDFEGISYSCFHFGIQQKLAGLRILFFLGDAHLNGSWCNTNKAPSAYHKPKLSWRNDRKVRNWWKTMLYVRKLQTGAVSVEKEMRPKCNDWRCMHKETGQCKHCKILPWQITSTKTWYHQP